MIMTAVCDWCRVTGQCDGLPIHWDYTSHLVLLSDWLTGRFTDTGLAASHKLTQVTSIF